MRCIKSLMTGFMQNSQKLAKLEMQALRLEDCDNGGN